MNNLASVLENLNQLKEAEVLYREALNFFYTQELSVQYFE
jgi:hypothetical protein